MGMFNGKIILFKRKDISEEEKQISVVLLQANVFTKGLRIFQIYRFAVCIIFNVKYNLFIVCRIEIKVYIFPGLLFLFNMVNNEAICYFYHYFQRQL